MGITQCCYGDVSSSHVMSRGARAGVEDVGLLGDLHDRCVRSMRRSVGTLRNTLERFGKEVGAK